MNINEDVISRKKLGLVLKEAREKAGKTQAQVAAEAKVNANFYSMIERGDENYSVDKLRRILKVLGIKSIDFS